MIIFKSDADPRNFDFMTLAKPQPTARTAQMEAALDCLLVHAPKMRHYYKLFGIHSFANFTPTGVLVLADLLDRAGRRTQVLNYGVEKLADESFSLGEYVRKTGVPLVGFSLYWHHQCYDTIELAREIKRAAPETRIVLGGFTAGLFHRELVADFPEVDFVIRGDAEDPLVELARLLSEGAEEFSGVANLTWRDAAGGVKENPFAFVVDSERLDALDYTRFDLVKNFEMYKGLSSPWWFYGRMKGLNDFFNRMDPPTFHISIGRGCTANCSWCGASREALKLVYNRKKLAWRAIEKIRNTIAEARKAGYEVFCLTFDPNLQNRGDYYSELFSAISDLRPIIHFTCYGLPQRDVVDAMAEKLPTESKFLISPDVGSERIRRANKGFFYTNQELFECLDYIKAKGAHADVCFSIGHGHETVEDMKSTFKLLEDVERRYGGYFKTNKGIMDIDPGSDLYCNPDKYGIVQINRSFRDFYEMHATPDSGTGFATKDFDYEMLMGLKCRHFCPLPAKQNRLMCNAIRGLNALGVGPAVFKRVGRKKSKKK